LTPIINWLNPETEERLQITGLSFFIRALYDISAADLTSDRSQIILAIG